MGLTTPPAPVNVAALFPELANQGKTTVRLHPRRGTPAVTDSSMGGPLLWPADEPWPYCEASEHEDPSGLWGRVAMVPVLQIYARDVPELPFPAGTDLCQVLWCPVTHEPDFAPVLDTVWRDSRPVTEVLSEVPEPIESEKEYLPSPCVLSPERVREFPSARVLPTKLHKKIRAWSTSPSNPEKWSYQYHLSTAPGTKVGGWIDWIQDPIPMECDRGHEMQHLLTIASWEHDGASCKTWTPLEEQHLLGAYQVPELLEPADIMTGGSTYLFICLECPDRPVETVSQCS
ncbi:DUF1963 domain-containing protein [Microtetraspora malaysiensis]|uniref:DUF1963 domain-containing protein n=1 Tax=Microtetraspora malaysiensis TaxID=161358 RepID=UPI003D89B50B